MVPVDDMFMGKAKLVHAMAVITRFSAAQIATSTNFNAAFTGFESTWLLQFCLHLHFIMTNSFVSKQSNQVLNKQLDLHFVWVLLHALKTTLLDPNTHYFV